MTFKGTVELVDGSHEQISATVVVDKTRVVVTSTNGDEIGDWAIREIGVSHSSDGVSLRVEGEELLIRTKDDAALAEALGLSHPTPLSERISALSTTEQQSDRISLGWAIGIVGSLVLVLTLAGLWMAGVGPFGNDNVATQSRTGPASTFIAATSSVVTATLSPPTSEFPTELEIADAFWAAHLLVWQEAESGGILGYIDRAIDAANDGQWGEAAVECTLAQSLAQQGDTTSLVAPSVELQLLSENFWTSIDEALYWCATGSDSVVDLVNDPLEVARALQLRMEDALRALGLDIASE